MLICDETVTLELEEKDTTGESVCVIERVDGSFRQEDHELQISDEEVHFSRKCITTLARKSCSKEGLKNPVIMNVVVCIIAGIPAIVLFSIYPQYILEFVIKHATVIQVFGPLVRILSKIFYALAFLPLGTLYKFAIGVLDIESNFVVALIYEAISTVCEIIAFQYHRVYGKLPDIEELHKFKKKLRQFRHSLDFKGNDGEDKLIDDRTLSTAKKLLEIYMIQNAWGVPDTPTTIYFATATNWSIFIFAASTFASNFTIGLIKVTAWIIALRQVQVTIEENPGGGLSAWDLLLELDDDLSLAETICITTVSGVGFLVCVYRACKFLWTCCLRSRYEECRKSCCHPNNSEMGGSSTSKDVIEMENTKRDSLHEGVRRFF